jgi:hypothetical protein
VSERVEGLAERADVGDPLLERQLVALLLEELLPGVERRPLGVDEEAVEVEEEAVDRQVRE